MSEVVGVRLNQVGDGVVRVVGGDRTPGHVVRAGVINDEGLGVVVGPSISQCPPEGEAMRREVRIETFTGQFFPRSI